jgi:hypothetical protein
MPSYDLTISQAEADEFFRSSPFYAELDDYHHDPETYGHVYTLADGRVALIAEGGEMVCIDPEDLD